MKRFPCVVTLLVFLISVASIAAAENPTTWRAGVASVVITPKSDMWMGGYAARTHPSTGTAQDLNAKALAIVDERGTRFVFITVDAIGIPRGLRQNIATRLAAAHQLQPHEFAVTA